MEIESLRALEKFLHAQEKAEKASQDHFKCPICAGDAEWFRFGNDQLQIWERSIADLAQ